MQTRSAVRRMVDEALAEGQTNVIDYIATLRANGHSIEEAWMALRNTTGVPVSLRALYNWLKSDEEQAS